MKAFIRRDGDTSAGAWIVCWLRASGEWWQQHHDGRWFEKGSRKPAYYGTRESPFPKFWKRCSRNEWKLLNRERLQYINAKPAGA